VVNSHSFKTTNSHSLNAANKEMEIAPIQVLADYPDGLKLCNPDIWAIA